jgi:Tfp pilus assembly protein PilV
MSVLRSASFKRRPRGMTLVEVMVSFAILIAGLVTIFAILNAAIRSHKRAVNETEAAIVAESIIAELRAEFFRGHVPRTDGPTTFNASTDYPVYSYNRNILAMEAPRSGVDRALADREYFVRVEVRWSDQGDNKSIKVDTVMFCNKK